MSPLITTLKALEIVFFVKLEYENEIYCYFTVILKRSLD